MANTNYRVTYGQLNLLRSPNEPALFGRRGVPNPALRQGSLDPACGYFRDDIGRKADDATTDI